MPELAKVLGLPKLTFYGTGLIIGSGIYAIVGAAAGAAGTGLWGAFLLASLVAGLSALAYAELVSMYPKAGAEYQYVREAFPRFPLAAGATGLVIAASAVASAATGAVAFGGYLRLFFDAPVWMSATGLIVAATLLNIVGVRESAWANIVMTLVEGAGLLLVIYVGATGPGLQEGAGWSPPLALVGAAGILFFVFLGFEDIVNLAEEAKRPHRDPALAIFLSLGIAAVLYVLVALAVIALAPPQELADTGSPLARAVESGPSWAPTAIGAVALFATANTVLLAMIAGSRLVFAVGRGGEAPRFLAKILPNRRTPWVASIVVAVGAAVVLPFGDIGILGATSSLAALVAFIIVDACVVRLRYSRPQAERPFRIWGTVGKVPVFPVLGAVGAVGFATQLPGRAYMIVGAAAVIIAGLLWWGRRARDRREARQRAEGSDGAST